jgi:hypothetical protein
MSLYEALLLMVPPDVSALPGEPGTTGVLPPPPAAAPVLVEPELVWPPPPVAPELELVVACVPVLEAVDPGPVPLVWLDVELSPPVPSPTAVGSAPTQPPAPSA